MSEPVGTLCIVLHTHLPWLPRHGTWPVGEEWLHQAWSGCYLPLVEMLDELAAEGRRDLLSLGVTPVLAAALDDPYALREHHGWLGRWQLRAEELARDPDPRLRRTAREEFRAATRALEVFGARWRRSGSAALRPLLDAGAVELLGGPLTHPILPLMPPEVAAFALGAGLDDAALRVGRRPRGIWAPECAWSPGLADVLTGGGVDHLLLDEATVAAAGGTTDRPWRVAGSTLAVAGRDLALTDLVWSSRSGFPAGPDYRDFHDVHPSGLRASRVTDPHRPDKASYDPGAAARAARRDAEQFVTAARQRLALLQSLRPEGPAPVAVVAWDTELFGHWWHEGPQFLAQVLRMLPEAGVRLATLGQVTARAEASLDPPAGSWGAGKDFRLWAGDPVADLAADARAVAGRLLDVVRGSAPPRSPRQPLLDDLAREALLALSSDWAFMVSRDSAAEYARERHRGHVRRFHAVADHVEGRGGPPGPSPDRALASHLDARMLVAGAPPA
ncbi:MAG: 1,4-alpha-glucan branching protein domain-containing protein [Sporichthyaceae bacterium]